MNRTYSEENGLYWITINPMKIANEDEEMVKNQETFQDSPSAGPCDGDTEKEDEYISDDNSNTYK